MKHVLLTGATGFIGRRLVDDLLAHGYRVRALARRELDDPRLEIARGDVTDEASLERAMAGVDGVLHLAAIYGFGVGLPRMRRVNVDGTRAVLDAAARAGVARVLYCGSDTSLGDTGGAVADEEHVRRGPDRSAYETTKREAHELVTARAAAGAPIVNAIVSTVYGPGDTSVIGELIGRHLAGKLPVTLDRRAGYTFAHVDDVARALRLAYERGRAGERYLVSGEPATFARFFEALAAASGRPAPRFEVPRWLDPVVPLLAPLAGKPVAELRELVAMGRGVTRFFSSARARRELGWTFRPLAEGLAQTVRA
jgi:dihydroflavonol-4-reductase